MWSPWTSSKLSLQSIVAPTYPGCSDDGAHGSGGKPGKTLVPGQRQLYGTCDKTLFELRRPLWALCPESTKGRTLNMRARAEKQLPNLRGLWWNAALLSKAYMPWGLVAHIGIRCERENYGWCGLAWSKQSRVDHALPGPVVGVPLTTIE